MAGHSKWANIKHRKAAQDKKRGKVFTRLIREITIAARLDGGDQNANPRLRAAIQTALTANMTKEVIDRAVRRGTGKEDVASLEEIRYEGYGPGGVALMVDCMTDNRNRTVSEIRYLFTKSGGNLGMDGSVSYLFEKKGIIRFESSVNEDAIIEAAIEAGAEDVIINDDCPINVIISPDKFSTVCQYFNQISLSYDSAEISMVAHTQVKLDIEIAEKIVKLINLLEELDDVQSVYTNAYIPNSVKYEQF